jgi:3-hydroxyisobutyrate dehydrogenase-like beta-hydroxyacid dehydrogenase
MTRFAVLGLGEAGGRLAGDLAAAGAEVRGFDPAVAAPDGVVGAVGPAEAVASCGVVLCVATATAARHVAEEALPGLAPAAVYADLNTAAPALKRELAELVEAAGARFADVALLGAVPARGLATAALAAGTGAQSFAEELGALGMPVEVVSGEPGDAAALKLIRSVFMKGLAAAALESLEAGEAAGRSEWLEEQLAGVIGHDLLKRLVEGSRRHAGRRVEEMDAACELLASLGVEPRIASASRAVLTALSVKTRLEEPT